MTSAILNVGHTNHAAPVVTFSVLANLFLGAKQFEKTYAKSDAQLAALGLTRDALVGGYIKGLGKA